MRLPTPKEITYYDHILMDLAFYEVTKGKIPIVDTPEEAFEIHKTVIKEYNNFKRMINGNECDLSFLQYYTYRKYSPFTEKEFVARYGEYDPDYTEKMVEEEEAANKVIGIMKNLGLLPDMINKKLTMPNPLTADYLDGLTCPYDEELPGECDDECDEPKESQDENDKGKKN